MLPPPASKVAAALKVLTLQEDGLTELAVNQAYRTAAKEVHPDTGNFDSETWATLKHSKDILLKYLATRVDKALVDGDCRACNGTGRIKRNSLQMACVMCNGTGEAK